MHLKDYKRSGKDDHPRRFQYTWFISFMNKVFAIKRYCILLTLLSFQ